MPDYHPIAVVASRIATTKEELLDLERQGWISTTNDEGGAALVSGRQEYKARFILHLRHRLHLTNDEITRILDVENPPYSLKDVSRILGRRAP